MSQTKKQIQETLTALGISPRKQFGQNFMADPNVTRLVANAGQIQPGDFIIEIGPGTGALTDEMASLPITLLLVEIDHALGKYLISRFASFANIQVLNEDALPSKHQIHSKIIEFIQQGHAEGKTVKLVANLPYNVASPIIIELLIAGIDQLVFTVQKEVAERLAAKPSTDAYGGLTAIVQMMSNVDILRTISAGSFWPAPKIESSLVRLVRNDQLQNKARGFGQFIQKIFSSRRKMLRRSLSDLSPDPLPILTSCQIDPQIRAEELDPQTLYKLYQALYQQAL